MFIFRQLRDLLLTDDEQHKHELIVPTGQDIYRVNESICIYIELHVFILYIVQFYDWTTKLLIKRHWISSNMHGLGVSVVYSYRIYNNNFFL